jgi:hypothetical protein
MARLQIIAERVDQNRNCHAVWSVSIDVDKLTQEAVVKAFEDAIATHGRAPQYRIYGLDPARPSVSRVLEDHD